MPDHEQQAPKFCAFGSRKSLVLWCCAECVRFFTLIHPHKNVLAQTNSLLLCRLLMRTIFVLLEGFVMCDL